ncbi:patatin family protein [Erysipelotrichaceae bacterium OttesenSCG-928-M19]|nr:patatin family protein [Erysipelotrichaceae bacterium OttesenSCG-928-M19]
MIYNASLILEGGGMRGVYTAGVLDCFMDENIYFLNVYGVSAGACHACSYLSKQNGRALRTVIDYLDKEYIGFFNLIKTGDFFNVKTFYDDIPNKFLPFDYQTFNESKQNLYVTISNCLTGKAEYKKITDIKNELIYIQASSSLPLLAKTVYLNKIPYLDGGITDSIPIAQAKADGNKINIVVLTQYHDYQKKPNRLAPLIKGRYPKYKELNIKIKDRHLRYNETLKEINDGVADNSIIVIQPQKPVTISRLEKDKNKLIALYHDGYNDAKAMVNKIKERLT